MSRQSRHRSTYHTTPGKKTMMTYTFVLASTEEEPRTTSARRAFDFEIVFDRLLREVTLIIISRIATRTIVIQPFCQLTIAILVDNICRFATFPVGNVAVSRNVIDFSTDSASPIVKREVIQIEIAELLEKLQLSICTCQRGGGEKLTNSSPRAPMRRSLLA
jgi:hypothetical protein